MKLQEFKNDKMCGEGRYRFKSGRIDEGTWKDNKLNGEARKLDSNGDVKEEGIFEDDELVKAMSVQKFKDGSFEKSIKECEDYVDLSPPTEQEIEAYLKSLAKK